MRRILKPHWHKIVITGLWAGVMLQFYDVWRLGLLLDDLRILIAELVLITLIALSGMVW